LEFEGCEVREDGVGGELGAGGLAGESLGGGGFVGVGGAAGPWRGLRGVGDS